MQFVLHVQKGDKYVDSDPFHLQDPGKFYYWTRLYLEMKNIVTHTKNIDIFSNFLCTALILNTLIFIRMFKKS